MVNLVAAHKSLLHCLMKMAAGIIPHTLEIEPGTVINIWVPSETLNKPKPTRPVVVLVHGFAGGGIYTWQFQVMFNSRKERAELLEGLVVSTQDTSIPKFPQRIHLLWGEQDQIFKLELAQSMKEQLGDKATFQGIKNAGHLVHLERPCVYNRCLNQFLARR